MYLLLPHIKELKKRIILSFLIFLINFMFFFYFSDRILYFFHKILVSNSNKFDTLNNAHNMLIYTKISEGFLTHFKISSFMSILISTPFFLFQIWRFISIGLYSFEKKILKIILFLSPILFCIGGFFSYKLVIPQTILFFTTFNMKNVLMPYIKSTEYISFIIQNILCFGLGFQFPIIIFILNKAKLLPYKHLVTYRKYFFFLILIIGSIITPPDILSPIIFTIPIYFLYEICIFIIKISYYKK